MNPTNPSPPASLPSAVSQAESVTRRAWRSQPRWISRTGEAAVVDGLAVLYLRERIGDICLCEDHRRLLRNPIVDQTVRCQVDVRKSAQRSGRRHLGKRRLARLGVGQKLARLVVSLE